MELSDAYSSEGLSQEEVSRVVRSLDPKGRGYVTYEAFESFCFSRLKLCEDDTLEYVPARRVLRGHSAPVCAISFLPHSSLLATAAADGTVRLWDPCHIQYNLVFPSGVHHLRKMPGYYFATPDSWVSPPAASVVLRLEDAATSSSQCRKMTATTLRSVSLQTRSTNSRIVASQESIAEALEFDKVQGAVRGLLYLLDDGTIIALATDTFDARLITLCVEDAGHFLRCGADAAMLRVIFGERHRILRVGFVASTAFHSFAMIEGALDTHRDQDDIHPLATPGGGDANVLRVLQINLVLFTQEFDSIENDVRHLLVDKGDYMTDTTTDCELLFAELTDGSKSVVVAWAVERATFMMSANKVKCELSESKLKDLRAGAIHSALLSWRHAIHAFRSSISNENKGARDVARATRGALEACAKASVRTLVQPSKGREEASKSFTVAATFFSNPCTNDTFLAAAFCASLAFQRIISRTGNSLVSSETLIPELRLVAETLRFDIRYVCLQALGAMPSLTLNRALRIMKLNRATTVVVPTVFFVHRALLGEMTYKMWQEVIDESAPLRSLKEAGTFRVIDCASFSQVCDFGYLAFDDISSTISSYARDAHEVLRSRDTDHTWLQRWACLAECERLVDQIRLAREEIWAATHPLFRRVDQLLFSGEECKACAPLSESSSLGVFRPRRTSCCLVSVKEWRLDGASSSVADAFCCTLESQANVEPALSFRLRGTFSENSLARIADTSSRLSHESLVPMLFVDDSPSYLFFDVREEPVTTLREVLSIHGGVGLSDRGVLITRLWLGQLSRGLAHMHARGLVCRTLRAEHIIVSSDGLRIVPLIPFDLDDDRDCSLPLAEMFSPDDVLTPPEAIEISMASGTLAFKIGDELNRPSRAWDSWSLGVLLCELICSTKPDSWVAQLGRYLRSQINFPQSGTMCNDISATAALSAAARSLHFEVFVGKTTSSTLAALRRGWRHLFLTNRHRDVRNIRDTVSANIAALASDARLRGDSFSPSDILHKLNEAEISEERLRSILVDEFRFLLEDADVKALVENYDEIKDAFFTEESPVLLSTLVACFETVPSRRITTTSLVDIAETLSAMDAAEARLEVEAYLTGALPKSSSWYQKHVLDPLERLESNEDDDFETFVDVARAAKQMVGGDIEDDDNLDLVLLDNVAERCVALAAAFENAGPVYPLILELLRRVHGEDASFERIVLASTKFLTLPNAPPRNDDQIAVVEEVLEVYAEIVPHEHLRSLVSASRALLDSTSTDGGRAGRRGAAKAFAMLCRNEVAASALLDADAPGRLLSLTSDRGCVELRCDAVNCAKHACILAKNVEREDDPQRLLAFEFTSVPWIAALSRILRSPSASRAETDAAYDTLGAMVDDAPHGSTRNFGSGGALTALIFALQHSNKFRGEKKVCQDTSEAGGRRNRLLQPFNDSSSHHYSSAKARRLLGDVILLGSEYPAASLLHSAYPHVVDAVLN